MENFCSRNTEKMYMETADYKNSNKENTEKIPIPMGTAHWKKKVK